MHIRGEDIIAYKGRRGEVSMRGGTFVECARTPVRMYSYIIIIGILSLFVCHMYLYIICICILYEYMRTGARAPPPPLPRAHPSRAHVQSIPPRTHQFDTAYEFPLNNIYQFDFLLLNPELARVHHLACTHQQR